MQILNQVGKDLCQKKHDVIPFRRGGDAYPPPARAERVEIKALRFASLPQRIGMSCNVLQKPNLQSRKVKPIYLFRIILLFSNMLS
jgi:hypothetical protein